MIREHLREYYSGNLYVQELEEDHGRESNVKKSRMEENH
jgi:hypothetical protein